MTVAEKVFDTRYLTHMIVFPDQDTFTEQLPFIHDVQFEARNWLVSVFHHQDGARELIAELLRKGECRCETPYPPAGVTAKVTHLYRIETEPRPCGWAHDLAPV